MCVSTPGRVITFAAERHVAVVDLGGRQTPVCTLPITFDGVALTPGTYVLVHTGFAVARLDAPEAVELQRLLEEVA